MIYVYVIMKQINCNVIGITNTEIITTYNYFQEQNPQLSVFSAIYRLYPYRIFLKDAIGPIETLLRTFSCKPEPPNSPTTQPYQKPTSTTGYIPTPYQDALVDDMRATCRVTDFCLVGPSGCGKTATVERLSHSIGIPTETIVLYQDMTSRDLLQQRSTLPNGDTVWTFSPLVTAAIEGKMAVLDGLHRLHPSTLAVLQRFVQDRELQLYDGKRLVSSERYERLKEELGGGLEERGVFRVDPRFRLVAIAEPPQIAATGTSGTAFGNWMSAEALSLFVFHEMRTLRREEEVGILEAKVSWITLIFYVFLFQCFLVTVWTCNSFIVENHRSGPLTTR